MPPPNEYDFVVQCVSETGDLISRDSCAFTDYVARGLMAKDPNWGRKARQAGNWDSRNSDALAYRMGSESEKHLVDIVVNSHIPSEPPAAGPSTPAWQVYEGPNVGNGYWMQEPGYEPPPNTDGDLEARVDALETEVDQLGKSVAAEAAANVIQGQKLAQVEARLMDVNEDIKGLYDQLAALAQRVTALEQHPSGDHAPVQMRTSAAGWGLLAHSHTLTIQQPR